jgi:hypothetical protein
VCVSGFCNVCVCEGFVMYGAFCFNLYSGGFILFCSVCVCVCVCACVCMSGFCNVCVCESCVMCGYIW